MKKVILIVGLLSGYAYGQHQDVHTEEVFVKSSPLKQNTKDTTLSVGILQGEELREKVATTLGETLSQLPGVQSGSFGTGVSQPVIRGQGGNRVRVLIDGLGTADAASVSPDHGFAVEPLVANQIEVIRGPSTLLYGNGAIGGVVNVIDNRIPENKDISGFQFEQRFNSVNDGNTSVLVYDGVFGNIVTHVDGSFTSTEDVEIPGFAIIDEDVPEDENSFGILENSDVENSDINVGLSLVGDSSYIGVSVSHLEKDYGLPPGAHGHEEEHEEEEEGHEEEEHEEEEEIVRIDLEQDRFAIKGGLVFDSFWKELTGHVVISDYMHVELEGDEIGTEFNNDSVESRFELSHGSDDWQGVVGLQLDISEFSAIGDEAFIPEVDTQRTALFVVESFDTGAIKYELGGRVENNLNEIQGCESDITTASLSASALFRVNEENNFLLGLNRSERAPTLEELFSNIQVDACTVAADPEEWVLHIPTRRIELGDPDLDKEVSSNIELAWRNFSGDTSWEVNLFYNQIEDYTFLQDRLPGEENAVVDESIVADFVQEDATFVGLEASLSSSMELSNISHFDYSLFFDTVRGELDQGGNLPRIPAWRLGGEAGIIYENHVIKFQITHVGDQDRVAAFETPSSSYTVVDFYTDFHVDLSNLELVLFLKADNLINADIREHSSITKEFAPGPGRGFTLGARIEI